MRRPKGGMKTGGRQKGVQNKKTVLFSQVLEELKFNIAEEAVKLYHSLQPEQKLECLKFMAVYTHAKPVEPNQGLNINTAVQINANDPGESKGVDLSGEDIRKLVQYLNTQPGDEPCELLALARGEGE